MRYSIRPTTIFQKNLKLVQKRWDDLSLLTEIIKQLAEGEALPEKNRDHSLGKRCISLPFLFCQRKIYTNLDLSTDQEAVAEHNSATASFTKGSFR